MESHLLQMRGLKHKKLSLVCENGFVASFTDAWIETTRLYHSAISFWSHLLQMRGLKQWVDLSKNTNRESHLLQMRGLKRCRSFGIFRHA